MIALFHLLATRQDKVRALREAFYRSVTYSEYFAQLAKVGCALCIIMLAQIRAVDPYSFFADPDSTVLLNADLDPAFYKMRIRIRP